MRKLRTGTSQPEMWDENDIMSYLGCDKNKAEEIMKECRKRNNIEGYGPVEKHLILDFIEEKQREQREREDRHKADIATARQFAVLEEQVKTLQEQNKVLREQDTILQKMCNSSSDDARKARTQSLISNFISGISIAIAILALVLK